MRRLSSQIWSRTRLRTSGSISLGRRSSSCRPRRKCSKSSHLRFSASKSNRSRWWPRSLPPKARRATKDRCPMSRCLSFRRSQPRSARRMRSPGGCSCPSRGPHRLRDRLRPPSRRRISSSRSLTPRDHCRRRARKMPTRAPKRSRPRIKPYRTRSKAAWWKRRPSVKVLRSRTSLRTVDSSSRTTARKSPPSSTRSTRSISRGTLLRPLSCKG